MSSDARFALLVSGASGMALPRTLLTALAGHPGVGRLHLVVSAGASQVLRHELGAERTGAGDLVDAAGLDPEARAKIVTHRDTVILPCSAGTLGALATGSSRTLVRRAGAVALKERWPLVVGFRETPLTVVHLENLRRLAYMGATILPPVPAFYVGGDSLERFLDHYALRILDRLGLAASGDDGLRWS